MVDALGRMNRRGEYQEGQSRLLRNAAGGNQGRDAPLVGDGVRIGNGAKINLD